MIITENLSKRFRETLAVDSVSLHVQKGEIFGFLGLNGAGKTTTIRMLLGMIGPTSGQVLIRGERVTPRLTGLWKNVGYIVETPSAYPNLTVKENLELVRRFRDLPESAVRKVIGMLELDAFAQRQAKKLSLGNAQRLGLAKALIHQPDILILDEPTNGLDPAGIQGFRELLKELSGNNGVTVFISSHILGEISRIADRIGIIHEGKLVYELDQSHLEALCQKSLVIDAVGKELVQKVLTGAGYGFSRRPGGALTLVDEHAVAHPDEVAELLVNAGCRLTRLSVQEEDLESFFLRTIQSTTRSKYTGS